MFDRRLLIHLNWPLFICAALLVTVGILTIYSSTIESTTAIYQRQLSWLMIGATCMVVLLLMDYTRVEFLSYLFYGAIVALLVAVLVMGHSASGAQRWISFGFVSVQPSEFSKLALIVALSKCLAAKQIPYSGLNAKALVIPSLLAVVPFLLVAKQPDLGTAMILLLIFSSMVLFVKIERRTLIGIGLLGMAIVPLMWHFLKAYQKARLLSFLNPAKDPFGMGYHLIQSKIAIGSGGLLGKGFLQGTQGYLKFLPEHHTDFIFSILAEEWGFIGSSAVIAGFLILILLGLSVAKEARDKFGTLLAFGVTAMLFWHIVINIGMVTGVLPVVGVPLPLMSYGGSFLVTVLLGIGILINVSMRRFLLR
ncbi:MAG: rod shape-determining protein RodA [Thermodesulfobacteriota bacterium]